ncbi:MAG: TonB-dependent receptor, partial [Planctomycetes bacterium]|nr:TonB-dependent receptor [Planctomycetota bacterium]
GHFYQPPNPFYNYVRYAYLESKIRRGGYFYPFGNPNLEWEKTIAYEVAVRHQMSPTAVFEVTAYYKSIKDLTQVGAFWSVPESHSSYRNDDHGAVKGFDFNLQTLRTNNLSTNLAYSLSWASGTGSNPSSTSDIAWQGEEMPGTLHPLDFDQRHQFKFDVDYRYQNNAPLPILNNAGVNVLGTLASGTPYTLSEMWNETSLGAGAAEPLEAINSRYAPWTFRVDLKANKTLKLGRLT